MSRYQIQKYVDCEKKELDEAINFYEKRKFTIKRRPGVDGEFITATSNETEIYIGFIEKEE